MILTDEEIKESVGNVSNIGDGIRIARAIESKVLEKLNCLDPLAYYDTQERGFYWAKPTKIEAPVTVKVAPIPLYALDK